MTEFTVGIRNRFPIGSGIKLKVVEVNGGEYIVEPQHKIGVYLDQESLIKVSILNTPELANCNIKLPALANFLINSDKSNEFLRKDLSTFLIFTGTTVQDWELNITAPEAFFEYKEEFDPYHSQDDDDVSVGENDGTQD